MKRILAIALAMMAAHAAQAQQLANAADSAQVARIAYRRATQATDAETALREISRSVSAWPAQPAYHWARAVLAAQTGDTALALDELEAYAAMALGRDLTGFTSLNTLSRFQRLRDAHDNNRAPIAASRVVLSLDDSTFWPEAADFDPTSRSWLLGSVRRGHIVRVDSGGHVRPLWAGDVGRRSAVLGLRVDTKRRAVWVATSGIPQREGFVHSDTANASLLELSLEDGGIRRRWDLPPGTGGHVLGDVAIGPLGDVFVTDSRHPVLYRLRPGADSLERLTHALFYSLQGIAPTPEGKWLYVADYSHGLLRVELATGSVSRLADAPRSTSVGCDGLTWHDQSLICVQNGVMPARIVRFTIASSGTSITKVDIIDRNFLVADEPTMGVMVGNEFVYVANSLWDKHDATGAVKPGAHRQGPVLLGVRVW